MDAYEPNASFLLPRHLAEVLDAMGRLSEQLSAGTYIRKVLEQLRIDLSWSSSRIEGNRYSLLDTEELAYLQPFEDGNNRVSRLIANVSLMLYNRAPLSFLDVDREDYAFAMMGVYASCDVSMAVDLFQWPYRRSRKVPTDAGAGIKRTRRYQLRTVPNRKQDNDGLD